MPPLSRALVCCAALWVVGGCTERRQAVPVVAKPLPVVSTARADALDAGRTLIAKHECTRCHQIDGLSGVGKDFDCAACHRMLEDLRPEDARYVALCAKYGTQLIERYRRNIRHYLQVPSLTGLGKRVRGDFIDAMLRAPVDQRPLLEESMIRSNLSQAERGTLVRYFRAAAGEDPTDPNDATDAVRARPTTAELERGRAVFAASGCPSCHTLGGTNLGVSELELRANPASALAPDLALTSRRMRGTRLVQWILQPQTLKPDSPMPAFSGSRTDAEAIADFLWFGSAEQPPTAAPPGPTKAPSAATLPRDVGWEEVKERVLGAVCVHCHMDDGEKDRGAGNTGGFGYAGVGLSMRTYANLVRGAVGPDGARYSVLEPRDPLGEPPIIEAVLRRRLENRWDHRVPFSAAPLGAPEHAAAPGMPLGLPALDDPQIALLRGWIAQGCPGPETTTGRPDVTNGYLVPDGPIAKNHGCEQRP